MNAAQHCCQQAVLLDTQSSTLLQLQVAALFQRRCTRALTLGKLHKHCHCGSNKTINMPT
jgi:hypothetical protein